MSETNAIKEWLCDGLLEDGSQCNARLGRFLNPNKISILGVNGQAYEIGFYSIWLTCKKCLKEHRLFSDELKELQGKSKEEMLENFPDLSNNNVTDLTYVEIEPTRFKDLFDLSRIQEDKLSQRLTTKEKKVYFLIKDNLAEIMNKNHIPENVIQEAGSPDKANKHFWKIIQQIRLLKSK